MGENVRRIAAIIISAVIPGCASTIADRAPPRLDAASVLARAKAASGGGRWDAVAAIGFDSALEAGGLRGSTTGVDQLTTGRSFARYTLGPVSGADGHDGRQSWSLGAGGEVTVGSGPGDRIDAANEAWLTARTYWFPDRRPGRVAYEREREEAGRRFHVVRAEPEGGRALSLWFDAGTGLLDRVVDDDGHITTTTTFADYRAVDRLLLPFAIRIRRGDPKYDTTLRVSRYRIDPQVAAADFAAPRSSFADVAFAAGRHETTLPFELVNNHIYIRAEVDGRPIRLLVDTGGANILTPEAARTLGLKSEGALEARGAGEESQDVGLTRARALRLGEVTIARPVFAVLDLAPLAPAEGVALSGLVGYEVFHRFVVRIDYADRRLTLIDPRHFDPRAVRGESLPFTWNGQTPVVEGVLDGLAGQFAIDTGSRSSLTLHAGFTAEHGLVARLRAAEPRVTGWGVGGAVRSRPARIGDLTLGSLHIRGVAGSLFTGGKGSFADRYHAGNIGGGVLRRFTVTFDYPHGRMILEPNRDFAAPDSFDRSGMWINAAVDAYTVVDVVPGGPAAQAGLQSGDRIVRLAGEAARFDDLAEARRRLREQPAGSRVPLVYERKGGRRTATVILSDQIPPKP